MLLSHTDKKVLPSEPWWVSKCPDAHCHKRSGKHNWICVIHFNGPSTPEHMLIKVCFFYSMSVWDFFKRPCLHSWPIAFPSQCHSYLLCIPTARSRPGSYLACNCLPHWQKRIVDRTFCAPGLWITVHCNAKYQGYACWHCYCSKATAAMHGLNRMWKQTNCLRSTHFDTPFQCCCTLNVVWKASNTRNSMVPSPLSTITVISTKRKEKPENTAPITGQDLALQ